MARWQRSADATWRCFAGGLVVAAPQHDAVVFSAPAGEVWEALEVPRDDAELARHLAAPLDEVTRFLEALHDHGAAEHTS
jgi:hypothetical protein